MLKRSFLKMLALATLSASIPAVFAQDSEDLLEITFEARKHFNQGMYIRSFQKFSEAIDEFNQAIELAPDFAEAYKYRAIDLYNLGWKEEAINDFKTAIRLYAQQGDLLGLKNAQIGLDGITNGTYDLQRALGTPKTP